MKIMIVEDGKYIDQSKDTPIIGRSYWLESAEDGTHEQNRAFHALVQEYWRSGLHPKYGGDDFSSFRDKIKRDLGEGFEAFVYADIVKVRPGSEAYRPVIKQVKKYEDIPEEIRNDPHKVEMIQGKLKSWSKYTKRQRMKAIDNVILDMTAAGVNSDKFYEIMDGLNRDSE